MSGRTRARTKASDAQSASRRTVSGSSALNDLGQPFLFFLDHTSALLAFLRIVDLRNRGDLRLSQALRTGRSNRPHLNCHSLLLLALLFGTEVEAVAQGAKEAARMTCSIDLGRRADADLVEDRGVLRGCALAVPDKVAVFASHVGSLSQNLIQRLGDGVPRTGLGKVTDTSKSVDLSRGIVRIKRARNLGSHNDRRTRSLSQLLQGRGGRELCSQGRLFIALGNDEDHNGIESNIQLGRDQSAIANGYKQSLTPQLERQTHPIKTCEATTKL